MGRAEVLLAACAITMALVAGAFTAIASADPGDSGDSKTTENTTDTSSDVGADKPADNAVANTYSGEADRTAADQPGDAAENTVGTEGSGDEQERVKTPVDDESGNDDNRDGRSANRLPPLLIPEAPPVADIAPPPAELPHFPQQPAPLPADVPPSEPDPVVVTVAGPIASAPDGNGSPVMRMPVILAPVVAPPRLGAAVTVRGTLGPIVTATPRWAGERAPSPRQAATSAPRLRELPTSSRIVNRGEAPRKTGYKTGAMPRIRLSAMAAGALPGLAGMMAMTAAGICLGHRQAMAAHQLRTQGLDRFLV